MKFYFAPLQGFTTADYCHFHSTIFKDIDLYCAPFMRVESSGQVMQRDINNLKSARDYALPMLPQAIFRNIEELRTIVNVVQMCGFHELDLNLGCPHVPQIKRGRGAGMLNRPNVLNDIARFISDNSDIQFSVKMRLGLNSENDWREILLILNDIPLRHITIHPRTASQKYGGHVNLNQFGEILVHSKHPIIYNGDINCIDDINLIVRQFPNITGIMIGRGLLQRPSLVTEWHTGITWSNEQVLSTIMQIHGQLFTLYRMKLCGEAQLLCKIKPFWQYNSNLIGRKNAKAIAKARNISTYLATISNIAPS